MTNDYSEFYHHETAEDGFSYSWIYNPVITTFRLKGSNKAYADAAAVAIDALLNKSNSDHEYITVKTYTLGEYFDIEIRTNNFIPQLYDAIKAIEGVNTLYYATYDAAYRRMLTDNKSMAQAIKRSKKVDVTIEVDDELDMFPEDIELSLPDLNEADWGKYSPKEKAESLKRT